MLLAAANIHHNMTTRGETLASFLPPRAHKRLYPPLAIEGGKRTLVVPCSTSQARSLPQASEIKAKMLNYFPGYDALATTRTGGPEGSS
jgi:hypothetical protein